MTPTSIAPSTGLYTEVRTMSPDGAYLLAFPPSAMRDLGWLSNDLPVPAVGFAGAPRFRPPSISLPMGGAPVAFELHTRHGRERTEPVPPGTVPPSLGFDTRFVERTSIRLDPRVLVLPVRMHASST
jgi:hypothetical protein